MKEQSFYEDPHMPREPNLLDQLFVTDEEWNAAYHARDSARLGLLLAEDWVGFEEDGSILFRTEMLRRVGEHPSHDLLLFERQACRVHGYTGFTRGILYASGKPVQSFMRIYAWKDRWQSVSVQFLNIP